MRSRLTMGLTLAGCAGWLLLACAGPLGAQTSATEERRPDLGRYFRQYGVEGTFVVYDRARDHWTRYNADRAGRRFIPASTFKIFNSLVALETGAVEDAATVIPWDSVDRGSRGWNQDQTLRTAFQRSAVWAYQELARRIGETRMHAFVRREHYGNEDIGGGIDRFWLTGALRISPNEQVAFLRRLDAGTVGFSRRSVATVRDIMVLEETPDYTLRGKTGWAGPQREGGPEIGWLVGWVERGGDTHFFALNLETHDPDFPMREARRRITYGILRELGVLPDADPPSGSDAAAAGVTVPPLQLPSPIAAEQLPRLERMQTDSKTTGRR